MATLDDLRELGYEALLSFEGQGFSVYRIRSDDFETSTQVRDDDEAAMQSIIDSHDEWKKQAEEPLAETHERWAADPEHPYFPEMV
jgi:hypothetical protein